MSDTLMQLTEVFREVFDDDALEINEGTSASDIESWDSLLHVTLMLRVERAIGVRFSSVEVASLQNVGELVSMIERKVRQ